MSFRKFCGSAGLKDEFGSWRTVNVVSVAGARPRSVAFSAPV